jgi:3-dehydroquinate dehydratase
MVVNRLGRDRVKGALTGRGVSNYHSRATNDPHITAEQRVSIEDVDIVGSSIAIGDLVEARGETGTFDYIVSSHNFEHLPEPDPLSERV